MFVSVVRMIIDSPTYITISYCCAKFEVIYLRKAAELIRGDPAPFCCIVV